MTDSERRQYYEGYNQSFILPADPYRYNAETKAIPRIRDLRQVNLKADITRGWRAELRPSMWQELREMHPDDRDRLWKLTDEQQLDEITEDGEPLFFRRPVRHYRRLDSCSDRTGIPYIVRDYFFKARSSRTRLKWYLVQHDRTARVNYLQFDLDMHGKWSRQAWAALQQHVGRIEDVVRSLGGEVVWTTSPGDVYGEQHVQGLYAWIKLDGFHQVAQLSNVKEWIKRIFELPEDTEYSWDHAYRAIRLPGQQYVELVDPRTMTLIAPVAEHEPQRKSFEAFCEAWHSAKTISLDALLALGPEPEAGQPADIAALPVIAPERKKQPAPAPPPSLHGRAERMGESTWQTALKTVSEALHRHRGSVSAAEDEAVRLLPQRCRIDSRTCSDSQLLRGMVGRIAHHFAETFRPRNERRTTDQDRYRRNTIDADIEDVIRVLGRHLFIKGLKNKLRRYLHAMIANHGRLACKRIYDTSDAIFAKREWFRLNGRMSDLLCSDPHEEAAPSKKRLSNFICVIDRHDYIVNKCRQYGFSPLLISELRKLKAAREQVRALLDERAEREASPHPHVIISRTLAPHTTTIASGSLDTECPGRTDDRIWRGGRWNSVLGH